MYKRKWLYLYISIKCSVNECFIKYSTCKRMWLYLYILIYFVIQYKGVRLYLARPAGGARAAVMAGASLTCGEVCGRRSAFLSLSDGVNIDSVLSCWSQWAHLKLHRVSRNLLWYLWHCAEDTRIRNHTIKLEQLNNKCGFILGCWHVRQWQQPCPAVWHYFCSTQGEQQQRRRRQVKRQ